MSNVPKESNRFKRILFKAAKPITGKVLKLKNRHKGESCYIFGDGISIKWFDLSAFSPKPTFSLSCIPFHNQASALNLRYGLLTEPYYFYPYFKMPSWSKEKTWWRNRINSKYAFYFKKNSTSDFFVSLSNYPVLRGKNIYYLFRSIDDYDFDFLQECIKSGEGIYNGSFRCSITLAIYMGFKDITLIGCDYTHEISRSLHWYEKGKGVISPQPNYERNFIEIAQKYINITTITISGSGSVLPARTYTEYTGKALFYQENHELASEETLKLLATWPGYKIF